MTQLVSYVLVVTLSASPVLLTACAAWCGLQVHESAASAVSSKGDAHAGHVADATDASAHAHHTVADQGSHVVDEEAQLGRDGSRGPRGSYRLDSNGRTCAVAVVSPATIRQGGRGQFAPPHIALPLITAEPRHAARLESQPQFALPPSSLQATGTRISRILRI